VDYSDRVRVPFVGTLSMYPQRRHSTVRTDSAPTAIIRIPHFGQGERIGEGSSIIMVIGTITSITSISLLRSNAGDHCGEFIAGCTAFRSQREAKVFRPF
jgi:hypothetical protein